MDELYDPAWAAEWDAVGPVCGDPDQPVGRVLFAIDPVDAVLSEAIDWRADLIVTHHPLFLRPVHGFAAFTPKGRLVHDLTRNGIALHVCHTNADAANPGVSDALARTIGLTGDLRPLDPMPANPSLGIGRVGRLRRPEPLRTFAHRVERALPTTGHGVRVAGDPDRPVQQVAVSGGAGDSYLEQVRRLGVDVYLTADLRHHPASEQQQHPDAPALVDVAHWASEWPWLASAAEELNRALAAKHPPDTVETRVSTAPTDPWNAPSFENSEDGGRP